MSAPRPYGLLAELTHRCPLACPYCSNPLELATRAEELPAEVWVRVLAQAAQLGVVQVGFSGGEPLLYADLPRLVSTARAEGLYANLITSGLGWMRGAFANSAAKDSTRCRSACRPMKPCLPTRWRGRVRMRTSFMPHGRSWRRACRSD